MLVSEKPVPDPKLAEIIDGLEADIASMPTDFGAEIQAAVDRARRIMNGEEQPK